MMMDIVAAYQADLTALLRKTTTDIAQTLATATAAITEFNAAMAARSLAAELEIEERVRHFRDGPRPEPAEKPRMPNIAADPPLESPTDPADDAPL